MPDRSQPSLESSSRHSAFVWTLDRTADVGRAMLAASRRLREAEVESPQLDAAVLMAHVLGVSKTWLYSHPTCRLSEDEISRYEEMVRRRMCHEPVAYLVGHKSFYGLDITVDRRVLIPRPETEMLVERTLEYVTRFPNGAGRSASQPSEDDGGARRSSARDASRPRVADVGTGSGAIAVAIAVNAPQAIIYATDVSQDALDVAAQNVWRYGVGEQVELLPGYLVDVLPEPVDVIVANLPYVSTASLAQLARQIRDFEPYLALDGGDDGLRVIASLFDTLASPAGRTKLRAEARLFLEIGADQGDQAKALAEAAFPDARLEVQVDYAGLDRLLLVMM